MGQSWDVSTLGKPVPYAKLMDFMTFYANNDFEDFYDYNVDGDYGDNGDDDVDGVVQSPSDPPTQTTKSLPAGTIAG